MKNLAERVAALTPQQRLLLERVRAKQKGGQSGEAIPARTGSGPWPACADQAALMFFQQTDASAAPYNIGNGQRVLGHLDHPTLEDAYRQLVQRQDMLRAYYPIIDGITHVAIAPEMNLSIHWIDVRDLPIAQREEAAQQQAARLINQPFDMTRGPIVRFVVIRVAEENHLFVPVMHHSITDAISYNIFFRELIALYWGLKRGNPISLPPLERGYVDYGLWRNQWLESDDYRKQLAWWREHLAGAPANADLPGDYIRPPMPSYRGSRAFFRLDEAATHALRDINRQVSATSLMTLLAASYALFYRYADLRDLIIAVPSSHREHKEMTHVIGYFLNYVPFRGRVKPGMTFSEILAETKATVLGGLAHKRVPFSSIVEAVGAERDPSRMPLAQLGFVYVSSAGLNKEAARLVDDDDTPPFRLEGYYADREISPMDLQLIFVENPAEVTCFIEYASDIFKPETMAHMAEMFRVLCNACLADPDRPIDGLPILEQSAAKEAMAVWNREPLMATELLSDTLHGRFRTQAARHPERVALKFGEHSRTYAEVDRLAGAVARMLVERGAAAETPVAVCMKPSPQWVAALLGVMGAGAAYVPIDPHFPQQRRLEITENVEPAMVLTAGEKRDSVWQELPVLNLDDLEDQVRSGDGDREWPEVEVDPKQIAFVIHTSGSTGRPKGVTGLHMSLLHRLNWLETHYPREPEETHMLYASPGVNESLMELFQALHYGGSLVIAPTEARKDPARLAGLLEKHGVQRLQMTSSLLRLLLARPDVKRALGSLRLLVLHGETLPVELARRFISAFPECVLLNNYGLSEASGAACRRVTEIAALPGSVPVGHSLGGGRLRLLDRHLQPLPDGAVGELYLTGAHLSRGYAGAPGLTAQWFLPDPEGYGERLFRTGDRARYDRDHGFTLFDRVDGQIKIRGNRVEPEEVEAALCTHPLIRDAALTLASGEPAAFIQLNGSGNSLTVNDYREHLAARLPDYMIPSVFVEVDVIPRLESGKIDRKSLVPPERKQTVDTSYTPPRNELETALTDIWSQAMKREQVGIDDDFYELGGHSLKAAEIAGLAARELDLKIPPGLLFQTRTIRRLTQTLDVLENWSEQQTHSGPILLNEAGRPEVFAFPPILGFAMVYRPLASVWGDVSLYGFDFLDVPEPAEMYADMIEQTCPRGQLNLLGYSAGGNLAFETTQVLEARGRKVARLILADSLYRDTPSKEHHVVREGQAEFLADLVEQLEGNPVMGSFIGEPYLRDLIRKTSGAFYYYHYSRMNEGSIAASIDFIVAQRLDAGEEPPRAPWMAATKTGFREHRGQGRHEELFHGEALAYNAALLAALYKNN